MNSRSFSFHLLRHSLAFMLLLTLLNSSPASSASSYTEWFFSCNGSLNCDSISLKEFPLWRYTGKGICEYPEAMNLSCKGSHATIEIRGAKYQLLGFHTNFQSLIVGEIGFSEQYCRQGIHNSSSNIYGIIPFFFCDEPQIPETLTCFRSVLSYMPFENMTAIADAQCVLSAVVIISPMFLNELGGLQEAAYHFMAEFESNSEVGLQACRSCSVSGGICGYEDSNNFNPLFFNQPKCFCQSSSYGFEVCPSSMLKGPEPSPSMSGKSNLQKKASIIVAIVFGSIIMIICIIMFLHYIRKNNSNNHKIDESIWRFSTHTPERYSYSKLKKITNSFKNRLGQGGFSTVYKGKLSDGREVAIKLLTESKGNSQDFINEVVSVTRTAHVNIAALLGFCYDGDKRALVYEYMPNGSLDKYIFRKGLQKNEMELDWKTLYNIVMGVARGLEYLHRDCNTKIVHFDIKPHNILLDSKFCPKISDFGLAKQCRAKESHVSVTGVKGTAGFIAPEMMFRSIGKVSHKSDVYSFGMLVLEIVGERKSHNEGSKEEYFPDWIYEDLGRSEDQWWGRTEEEEEMIRKMIIVGLCCIQTSPDERPPMSEVVAMLEASVDGLQIPPKPTLFRPPATTPDPLPSSSSSFTSY